jgi:hypothetical protein
MSEMTKYGFKKLGPSNYTTWSKHMKALLATKGYEEALTDEENQHSSMAQGLMGMCVQDYYLTIVSNADSAHAAWTALSAIFQGTSAAHIIHLKKEMASLEKRRDEGVLQYISRAGTLKEQIEAATANEMAETDLVAAILSGLPSRFSIIKTIIEAAPALPTLQELTAKLLMVEADRSRGGESAHFSGDNSGGYGGYNSRPFEGRQVYVPPHRRNTRPSGRNNNQHNQGGKRKDTRTCYFCEKPGHLKKDCFGYKAWKAKKERESRQPKAVVALSAEVETPKPLTADKEAPKKLPDKDKSLKALDAYMSGDEEDPVNFWYADSGASRHLTGYQNILHGYKSFQNYSFITYGNNEKSAIEGVGDVILNKSASANCKLVLKDVGYAPKNAYNLLSVSAAAKNGVEFVFKKDYCYAYKEGDLILKGEKTPSNLYKLTSVPILPKDKLLTDNFMSEFNMMTKSYALDKDPKAWHIRLGHAGYSTLKKMIQEGSVTGIPITAEQIEQAKEACETCLKTKLKRLPFQTSESKAKAPLDLIHMDLCGPLPETLGEAKYFATFLDDYSGYSVVKMLKKKSDVAATIKEVFTLLENQLDKSIKAVRTDNGGEYVNNELTAYFKEKGIEHQTTMAHTPEQNGRAERLNQTLEDKAKPMLSEAGLPESLWGEAVNTANYLRIRTPMAGQTKTPFELMWGKKPDLSHLRPFGCEAFVLIPKVKRTKLDDTSDKGIMVGYAPNGYRILMQDNTVRLSRDVVFNEAKMHTTHSTGKEEPLPEEETKEDEEEESPYDLISELETDSESGDDPPDDSNPGGGDGGVGDEANPDGPGSPTPSGDSPTPSDGSPNSDSGSDPGSDQAGAAPNTGVRVSARGNRGVPASRLGEWLLAKSKPTDTIIITEPQSLMEARQSEYADYWEQATKEEYLSLLENGTWELGIPPPGVKPLPNKWVFKLKTDAGGMFERFKTRLVIKGFLQKEGIDYNETFAPTSKYATVRAFLAKAAAEDMEVHQIDIKTAFLHGELEEEIWMQQPEGFEEGPPGTACRLLKSLYGLKQAPRAWYLKLSEELGTIGFKPSLADPSLFTYKDADKDNNTYLLDYVDDMLVSCKKTDMIQKFKEKILTKFKGKDLGEVKSFLGINITRNKAKSEIKLDQTGLIDSILQQFGMEEAKTKTTPLSPGIKLTKTEGDELDKEKFPYGTLIGKLMFLTVATRPDLAYSVGTLARFISEPTTTHWKAAKGILRYLAQTKNRGITFRGSDLSLIGYCDADFAGDLDTRKSTTGYLFKLNGGAISWSSKRQPTVALSTTEAEFMAAAGGCKEGLWLRKLFDSLDIPLQSVHIYCDNQSTIKLLKNPIFSVRSKHIDVMHHFARERVRSREVAFSYISTTEMAADIFTKALPLNKHEACCAMMGLEP